MPWLPQNNLNPISYRHGIWIWGLERNFLVIKYFRKIATNRERIFHLVMEWKVFFLDLWWWWFCENLPSRENFIFPMNPTYSLKFRIGNVIGHSTTHLEMGLQIVDRRLSISNWVSVELLRRPGQSFLLSNVVTLLVSCQCSSQGSSMYLWRIDSLHSH